MRTQSAIAAIATLTLSVLPFPAQASDWFVISPSENNQEYYFVDRDSITVNNSLAQVLIFVVYSNLLEDEWVGFTSLQEYSCVDKKYRILRVNDLSINGSVYRSEGSQEWLEVPTGSIGELIRLEVCPF